MPISEKSKANSIDELRHAEYYGMQPVLDELYDRSKKGEIFTDLMKLILSRENILLAYRNIKSNQGSATPGTDGVTIETIQRLNPEQVVEMVKRITLGTKHGYRPKPVRRKDIPKPNGKTRPLGIPCMWDRLVQQCIKQIMEPICEAKFSDNSYGFRPSRSTEHAIAETHRLMQRSRLHYIVEFDIEGFFDNVNHAKLIRQIWGMGIRDKTLIFILKRILKAPIRMPNGDMIKPEKGTPQGGIISPLLANIVLNELDQWVDRLWIKHPKVENSNMPKNKAGTPIKSNIYVKMRKQGLKELYIIRYADDFRIFCRTKPQADWALEEITKWLEKRLKLRVSREKTRIVNVRSRYSEFLGYKLKVYQRANKWVVKSHISDKKLLQISNMLAEQIEKLPVAKNKQHATSIIRNYNAKVMGVHNYFCKATEVCKDLRKVQYRINAIINSRLKGTHKKKGKLSKSGRELSTFEKEQYGRSKALRYYKGNGEPIYPISFVTPRPPISKAKRTCIYTADGRLGMHDNLRINVALLRRMMKTPVTDSSIEYADNRLSLFSAQYGQCYVTHNHFEDVEDIHCHHKIPRSKGGTDEYHNLVLVFPEVHKLIHATRDETINQYKERLGLNRAQIDRLNNLRRAAGLEEIS